MDENTQPTGAVTQSSGPIIGIVIIIILLLLGGVYVFLNQQSSTPENIEINLGTTRVDETATTSTATSTDGATTTKTQATSSQNKK